MAKELNALIMIVEKGDNEYWGRVKINDNLIVDVAETIEQLKKQFKVLIFDFEGIEVHNFDIRFDETEAE